MLGHSVKAITEVVTELQEAAVSNGLVINEDKTKYTKRSRNVKNLEPELIIGGQELDGFQSFTYLGSIINSGNTISEEIKSRIAANVFIGCDVFRPRTMSKLVTIKAYKT
jgi:hypothetical protein